MSAATPRHPGDQQAHAEPGCAGSANPPRSYYGKPIINRPVWTWEIPTYFYAGGLAGVAASLAAVSQHTGPPDLAKASARVAAAGALAAPPLLISDLGRPSRFHHMLRIVKPTSPMSLGSWLLAGFVPSQAIATILSELDQASRLGRLLQTAAGVAGPLMSTYTAALLANTAVPVWHEARRSLPFTFAGSSLASAGAAVTLTAPSAAMPPARRLAIVGGLLELGADAITERHLGWLGEPLTRGVAGRWRKLGQALTSAGTAATAASVFIHRRQRTVATIGALMTLSGAACQRWAIFKAGFPSADDPSYTVGLQRQNIKTHRDEGLMPEL